MLLIQIIGSIATAVIAIILLKKDWRTKNEAIRKEAVLVTKIIFAVTIVSILNLAVTSFQGQYEISKLEKDKRQLQVVNANLSFNISKIAATQPVSDMPVKKDIPVRRAMQKPLLATNEEAQSSPVAVNKIERKKHELLNKKTQKRLIPAKLIRTIAATSPSERARNVSNEPDGVPLFHFISTGGRVLSGVLVSKENRPIYNLSVKVTNYDDLLDCRCFVGNTNSVTIGALNSQSTFLFKLPQFDRRTQSGRYLITLRFNNRVYYEEAIYAFSGRRHFNQALRIKQYEGSSLVQNTVMRSSTYQLRSVNWDRGFPLSMDEQARKAYIASN